LASCAVLQRLGFVQEGVLRQRWMAKGTVYDVAVFGLLNQQWQVASQS
jgi:[ribosomal protein S5]-alanine N-acetyltransferase